MNEPTLHPLWRQVLADLIEAGLKPGDRLFKSELAAKYGLKVPVTAQEKTDYDLELLSIFQSFRDELLEEHRLDLRSIGVGGEYVVMSPVEQTRVALKDGQDEMRRAIRRMARRVSFVRLEELTDEQRRENTDAQAKVASIAALMRKRNLLK